MRKRETYINVLPNDVLWCDLNPFVRHLHWLLKIEGGSILDWFSNGQSMNTTHLMITYTLRQHMRSDLQVALYERGTQRFRVLVASLQFDTKKVNLVVEGFDTSLIKAGVLLITQGGEQL